jgi:RND family efflux transporter MFP subunit
MIKGRYILMITIVAAAFACTRKPTTIETVRTVKIDTVQVYGESPAISFPGKIKAAADVNLSFKVAGPLAEMLVGEGTFVRKGQTLAEIDSRDYKVQLSATEAEYLRIKAEAERIISLHQSGSVTPNDYDKAVYGLQQITAKYNAHQNALTDTRLLAPFDGYVQKRFFSPGETVAAGMPVLSMIDAGRPEVEINIPSSEFIQRDRFETFTCTVNVYPDVVFALDLLGVAQKANMNQLYTLRLKIRAAEQTQPSTGRKSSAAPQALPSPGMVTMVTIGYKTELSEQVLIPHSAMFEQNSISSVWVYNPFNGTVSARQIKPYNLKTDGTIVVTEGLKSGEIIISAGVRSLHEGERVKLLTTTAKI